MTRRDSRSICHLPTLSLAAEAHIGTPWSKAMHWTLRLYFLSALLIVLAAPRPGAGQAQNQQPSLTPFRDLFMDLDANSDNAIEKAEVPEPGRKAFERLLSHGDANH